MQFFYVKRLPIGKAVDSFGGRRAGGERTTRARHRYSRRTWLCANPVRSSLNTPRPALRSIDAAAAPGVDLRTSLTLTVPVWVRGSDTFAYVSRRPTSPGLLRHNDLTTHYGRRIWRIIWSSCSASNTTGRSTKLVITPLMNVKTITARSSISSSGVAGSYHWVITSRARL